MARKRPAVAVRSWTSDWIAQTTGRCSTCDQDLTVMLIENDSHVCARCHEQRFEQWRREDVESERREAMWDAWTYAANRP
jgi:hypothetical protein